MNRFLRQWRSMNSSYLLPFSFPLTQNAIELFTRNSVEANFAGDMNVLLHTYRLKSINRFVYRIDLTLHNVMHIVKGRSHFVLFSIINHARLFIDSLRMMSFYNNHYYLKMWAFEVNGKNVLKTALNPMHTHMHQQLMNDAWNVRVYLHNT